MLIKVDEELIDVIAICNKDIKIYKIKWKNREYKITKIGYHHKFFLGSTLIHVFHISNDSLAFRIVFNTNTLRWKLTEVSDGQPN